MGVYELDAPDGFEPSPTGSEPGILPLDDGAMNWSGGKESNLHLSNSGLEPLLLFTQEPACASLAQTTDLSYRRMNWSAGKDLNLLSFHG